MRLVKQRKSLRVRNLDKRKKQNENRRQRRRHSELLPNSIRCIVVGPSNCGKTNVMVCLLQHPNGLKFRNVYLYSKTPFQPKYEELRQIFDGINGLGYNVYSDTAEIVPPNDAASDSVFIFDDVACDKQNAMREYFSMGRHSSVDSFYLCQTYSRIPKQLIRDNANLLVVFKQDNTNLRHIYDDHVNTDFTFEDFRHICSVCWQDKYGFLVIDKDSNKNEGRYRKGFDTFIEQDG